MGIYPTVTAVDKKRGPDGAETWEEMRETPGLVESRTVSAAPWRVKERTDCFCCSCGDDGGSDPYCRNHGWAARRPCEKHDMPGELDDDGNMPDSVQVERTRHIQSEPPR